MNLMEGTASTEPIPVAERSMPRVCGRSFAENEGSNPAWISVSCECCVFSGRALCDEPIPHSEESYRLWCDIECGLETSTMRWPWPALGCCAREEKKISPGFLYHYNLLLLRMENRRSTALRSLTLSIADPIISDCPILVLSFWLLLYNSPSLRLLSDQSFTVAHKTVLLIMLCRIAAIKRLLQRICKEC